MWWHAAVLAALAPVLTSSIPLPDGWDQADAVCVLAGAAGQEVEGAFAFRELRAGDLSSGLEVSYSINGLTDGDHPFHVHRWGDVSSAQAAAVGGHFVGICRGCRPDGKPQEVGLLNNGTPIASANGEADGVFVDAVAKLRGKNSILGRSVVVHGELPDRSGQRHAQCTIGLKQIRDVSAPPEAARDLGDPPGNDDDEPAGATSGSRASCVLRPVVDGSTAVTGHVVLAERPASGGNGTWLTYRDVGPLPSASTAHHVHAWGDTSSTDGGAAGGHFLGACNDSVPCRPPWASAQEVGMLFNNGLLNGTRDAEGWGGRWAVGSAQARDGVVLLQAGDDAALRARGVLGRSIVVHAEPSGGAREGQCAIGLADPGLYPAEDCSVGAWGDWGPCDCPDGGGSGLAGVERRTRPVEVQPVFGGQACGPLVEERACGPCPRSKSGDAARVIAGVVGGMVVVALVVAGVYLYRRRAMQYQEDTSRLVQGEVVEMGPAKTL